MPTRVAGAAISVCFFVSLTSGESIARSTLSASPTAGAQQATAAVQVRVEVPRMLYFQIGSAGATVNTLRFDARLRAPLTLLPIADTVHAGAVPPTTRAPARADDDGASNGNLQVRIWSNNGSVSLDCAGAPLTAGSLQIPLTRIAVSSTNATLAHPGTTLACAARSIGSAGTNDLRATWRFRYSYGPGGMPPAGNYTTTVTYTASQP